MFATALTTERTKLLVRRPIWIALIVLSGCLALVFGIFNFVDDGTSQGFFAFTATWTNASRIIMIAVAEPLLLIVMMVASGFFGMEYTWRTINLWLSRGVPRSYFFSAKLITLLVAAYAFSLIGTALVLAGNYFTFALGGKGPSLAELSLGAVALSTLALTLTLLPYVALVVLLTVLGRSSAVGIGGGLAYTLLLEALLAFGLNRFSPRLVDILPGTLRENMNGFIHISADAASAAFPWSAALGLAVWTVVLLGAAYIVFRQQDLTA